MNVLFAGWGGEMSQFLDHYFFWSITVNYNMNHCAWFGLLVYFCLWAIKQIFLNLCKSVSHQIYIKFSKSRTLQWDALNMESRFFCRKSSLEYYAKMLNCHFWSWRKTQIDFLSQLFFRYWNFQSKPQFFRFILGGKKKNLRKKTVISISSGPTVESFDFKAYKNMVTFYY